MGGAILWYGSDRQCCIAVMDELVENIRHGKLTSEESFQALITSHQTGPAVFTGMILPSLSKTADAFARGEESARVTQAGLAWLLFRARYHRDPKSLQELVPEFLPAVPNGVFHEQSLLARVDSAGLIEKLSPAIQPPPARPAPLLHGLVRIYTVGKNGKDDLGMSENLLEEIPPATNATATQPDDTAFRLPPLKVKEAQK
jgi:hypothetical protein